MVTDILACALLVLTAVAAGLAEMCVVRWRDGHVATRTEIAEDIREDLS